MTLLATPRSLAASRFPRLFVLHLLPLPTLKLWHPAGLLAYLRCNRHDSLPLFSDIDIGPRSPLAVSLWPLGRRFPSYPLSGAVAYLLLTLFIPTHRLATPHSSEFNDTRGNSHSHSTAPTRFSSQPIAASSSRSSLDRKP